MLRYPEAKIVAAKEAELKLLAANALPNEKVRTLPSGVCNLRGCMVGPGRNGLHYSSLADFN